MFLQIIKFLSFYFSAKTKYAIHSPFVFAFIEEILENESNYYSFLAIEHIRKKIEKNSSEIIVNDLGAGSKKIKTAKRKISTIAKTSLQEKKMAQLLFKMINYYKLSDNVVELGTSLGITTAYLANAKKSNKIYTIEGSTEIANVANSVFKKLGLKNIELIIGDFNMNLKNLNLDTKLGLIYIDGNHTKSATISYFNWALENANENTVIVIDDIYWSKEMEESWDYVKKLNEVTMTIDLFKMGIVFLHSVKVKEHFKLKKSIF